jgi:hypothetical protein
MPTEKVAKKDRTEPTGSPRPSRAALPPELLSDGVRRLRIAAALAFGIGVFFGVVDVLVPPPSSPASRWLGLAALGISSALSAGMFLLTFRRSIEPVTLLDVALVYQVLNALAIAVNYHSVPLAVSDVSRGWSGAAVWVLVFPLLIPSTRGKVVLATLASAAMDPLGLLIHVAAGAPMPKAGTLLQAFSATGVAAFLGIFLSGLMYRLSVEVGKAREMGSYRLIELLGSGGMGEVWRAEHRMLARPAAIKLIRARTHGASYRELIRRFEREARATATLRSPHTVQVYDFGTTDDGTFYYVMELLEGYDLDTLVTQFGALPPERAIHLLRQACRSLGEAHQGGFIHRDIKPANIYACHYGDDFDFVKVLDFGLVTAGGALDHRQSTLTAVGTIAGTPGYMAPEMAHGNREVDWRADLYSLGCVGYWLLTGKPVFENESSVDVLIDHARTPPVPPSQRAPQPLSPEIDEIILACLQKDPMNRPQSADEISESLARVYIASPWTRGRARRWWLAHPPSREHPAETAVPQGITVPEDPTKILVPAREAQTEGTGAS